MKHKGIIFDLDGTLLNTLEDLADSVNYVLDKHNYPIKTIDEIRSFVGNGVAVLMEKAIPDGKNNSNFETCLEEFKVYYGENMKNKTAPYEGILDLLKELSSKGYIISIVSNKFDTAVKKLRDDYFSEYVSVAIGQSEEILKKPAPDMVYKALEEMGCTSENSIYIGDSEVDMITAKNSNLVSVGVTWGFRDKDVLEKYEADYIIDKPLQILEIVSENK